MTMKTFQFNRKTAAAMVVISAVLLIALILFVSARTQAEGGVRSMRHAADNEARIQFLSSCGWEVESEPVESRTVLIPREFSDLLQEYNALQLASGFDLSGYAGLRVEQFQYRVLNYDGYDGEVIAVLYVHNQEIIGGDIHATALDGFMHGLK